MKSFFSCDWGTSTFRLRLINAQDQTVLSEIKTDYGIAAAFDHWKQSGSDEQNRVAFYKAYISEQIKRVTTDFDDSFENNFIVLSGMASSSIGMLQLPYKELPFNCNGSDLKIDLVPGEDAWSYPIIIVSGARSENDVIRGEETMLAGCAIEHNGQQQLFIFPGTHSKHMVVRNGIAESFATYMTGELFNLLSNKSILSASVQNTNPHDSLKDHYFTDGVLKGASSNIMNSIFHVRTNQLFKRLTPEQNYNYLSGLLIGHELKEVAASQYISITLVCSEGLKSQYMQALRDLGLNNQLKYNNADDALIKGQWKIMQQNGYAD